MELLLLTMVVLTVFLILGAVTNQVSTQVTGSVGASATRAVTSETELRAAPTVLAAQLGTLTTRGSDTAGTITMDSASHGITTGQQIDLYWTGGKRYRVTVGTVSSTAVPITAGSGDNLPVLNTEDLLVAPISVAPFNVDGDEVDLLVLTTQVAGYIRLVEDDGSTETVHLNQYVEPTQAYIWDADNGLTNPIATDTINEAHFSQNDSTASTSGHQAYASITN